ncbi:GNAT family N-acetyltransferase [Sphingomonas sp. BK580]|uniref:GNAT family N-acetyltransferase n=1 Tax=Sphingomonas sp. BK580 TaxID=2586972 RepID=UPI001613FB35|nr:GNAT family N-acetyltransferase [Sphingomonas sp. BK580]MBB3693576.1 GNAT superfamily N-acetyltransferase [Sphingomonas sp. BK580]
MVFMDAVAGDAAEIASVVNAAYRAEGAAEGWTNERGLLDGARISEEGVRTLLERGRILLVRSPADGPIAGCIHIAIDDDGAWHTSMLAVDPNEQTAGIGKTIKQEVERQARAADAPRMRMAVIRQREALIAWHRRRGYVPTGETLAFPYDDPSVGRPLRPDLELVVMEKLLLTSAS